MKRKNHTKNFKTKVALAAIKIQQLINFSGHPASCMDMGAKQHPEGSRRFTPGLWGWQFSWICTELVRMRLRSKAYSQAYHYLKKLNHLAGKRPRNTDREVRLGG
jgi:hypothetical protein